MGAYLTSPVRDKISEDKTTESHRYGASSMQGWRVSQEDAHNCISDYDKETETSFFAVYDGHGGAEVAQYTSNQLPDHVKNLDAYKSGKLAQALEDAFLSFDKLLTNEAVIEELRELAGIDEDEEDENDPEGGEKEALALEEEANIPIEELMKRYGGMDNKKLRNLRKDEKFQSPAIKPKQGDGSADKEEGEEVPSEEQVKTKLDSQFVNGHSEKENKEKSDPQVNSSQETVPESNSKKLEKKNTDKENDNSVKEDTQITSSTKEEKNNNSTSIKKDVTDDVSSTDNVSGTENKKQSESSDKDTSDGAVSSTQSDSGSGSGQGSSSAAGSSSSAGPSSSTSAGSSSSGSSSGAGGSGSAGGSSSAGSSADADQAVSSTGGEPGSSSGRQKKTRKNIIPDEGEDESSAEETSDEEDEDFDEEDEEDDEGMWEDDEEDEEEDEEDGLDGGMEMSSNGEEPAYDSGCTAVVALLRGKELYVANAGDSRCVVCREGKAVDMSVDHKPEDEPELKRIIKAGGKVTNDGRVNGGLNLSRALGDHHYKKNTDLCDKEQMITALPDVRCLSLDDKDQFMVLACDGIWNVMTSQDVCNFVAERLKTNSQSLSSICEEMFDFCLAPDSLGDGTGCDNMTCIIVSFDNLKVTESDNSKRRASTELNPQEQSQPKRQKTETEENDK